MAQTNIYQGQIIGPFNADQSIISLIRQQCAKEFTYLQHVGITAQPGTLLDMTISGTSYVIEIGNTGMYEIGNARVSAIKFKTAQDNNTIVDYVIL